MSRGMRSLAVHSGLVSTFWKPGVTGLNVALEKDDLWDLPKGSVILDCWIAVTTADTDTGAVNPLIRIIGGATIYVSRAANALGLTSMTKSQTLNAPLAADTLLQLEVSLAADGDGVFNVMVMATRPGPEPQ